MTVDTSVRLRLSIWRDFVPRRPLLPKEADGVRQMLTSDSNLQEEVYSWQLREDPFAGVTDEDVRRRLRERLLQRLEASRPPSERRLAMLSEFVTEAQEAIASGAAGFAPSQDPSSDDEDAPGEIHALLALTLHVKWLSRCFANRPGISVSVR